MQSRSDLLAIVVLGGIAVALVLWIVFQLRRSTYPPLQSAIYFLNLLLSDTYPHIACAGDLNLHNK